MNFGEEKKVQNLFLVEMRSAFKMINTTTLPGEGNGTPLQYSCLENPMGGGAW